MCRQYFYRLPFRNSAETGLIWNRSFLFFIIGWNGAPGWPGFFVATHFAVIVESGFRYCNVYALLARIKLQRHRKVSFRLLFRIISLINHRVAGVINLALWRLGFSILLPRIDLYSQTPGSMAHSLVLITRAGMSFYGFYFPSGEDLRFDWLKSRGWTSAIFNGLWRAENAGCRFCYWMVLHEVHGLTSWDRGAGHFPYLHSCCIFLNGI